MAINLLDMVQSQLGGAAMSQIGKFLGEDESKAAAGMGAALPAILGSVIQKGSTESGASGILDMLSNDGHDGSLFDNLGGLLGGGNATNGLMNTGSTLLNFFMGNRTQAITDLIIKATGLGKGTVGSILRLAAPMLVGMLGKHVKKSGLSAKGLMDFLTGQKDYVKKAAPAGLGSALGFAGFGDDIADAADRAADKVGDTVEEVADAGGSMMRKLLPWLGIAVLLFGIYWLMTGRKPAEAVSDAGDAVGNVVDKTAEVAGDAAKAVANTAGDAAEAVGDAAGAAVDAAGEALDATVKAARAALASIKFAAGSAGESLYNLLKGGDDATGKSVVFKNLTFATGSANITPETAIEVENLAKVLNAYPGFKIEIGGHTDNTGDAAANLELSRKRAIAVAKMLVNSGGVDRARISTFGYGDGKPIGDNNTEEGRAMNRRIEVMIK